MLPLVAALARQIEAEGRAGLELDIEAASAGGDREDFVEGRDSLALVGAVLEAGAGVEALQFLEPVQHHLDSQGRGRAGSRLAGHDDSGPLGGVRGPVDRRATILTRLATHRWCTLQESTAEPS